MGIWHNSGAWGPLGKALSFQEASKDKMLSISVPYHLDTYMKVSCLPWGEPAQREKSVCWLEWRERKEPVSLIILWAAEVTYRGPELLIMWKNTFPSPLFKLLLVAFSLTCNWSVQFSSVTQSYQTLCDPMNHSTPGLPVHHQLLEFTQTHALQVSDAIQPSHPLLSLSPPAPQSLRSSGSFPMSQLFAWGG